MNAFTAEPTLPRFRIAPTPSGFLHEGNITAFFLTWACCKARNGKLLLRIDDLDQSRLRSAYLDDIFYKLDYYQIDYDEGPSGPDDLYRSWSQTKRIDLYRRFITRLHTTGLLFVCNCSRSEIAEGKICPCKTSAPSLKKGALKIATDRLPVIRWKDLLSGDNEVNLHLQMPDFVIQKKDNHPSYQLTSLADDLHYGITDIIRGNDLKCSTAAQLALADLLQEQRFRQVRFYHHPLILSSQGKKLSKTAGHGPSLQRSGQLKMPDVSDLIKSICNWLRLQEPVTTSADLIAALKLYFSR